MKFTKGFNFGQRHENVKVDLPKMQEGREDAVFMVAYLHQDARDDESLQAATQKAVDILYQISEQVKQNGDQVGIAYTVDDLIYLKNAGKKAIFLAIENGYAIGKDLGNLTMFKDMGITYITLCHNGSNDTVSYTHLDVYKRQRIPLPSVRYARVHSRRARPW